MQTRDEPQNQLNKPSSVDEWNFYESSFRCHGGLKLGQYPVAKPLLHGASKPRRGGSRTAPRYRRKRRESVGLECTSYSVLVRVCVKASYSDLKYSLGNV